MGRRGRGPREIVEGLGAAMALSLEEDLLGKKSRGKKRFLNYWTDLGFMGDFAATLLTLWRQFKIVRNALRKKEKERPLFSSKTVQK